MEDDIEALRDYYGSELLARSPLDDSPYWPPDEGGSGDFVPGSDPADEQYRRVSYGLNNLLVDSKASDYPPDERISNVDQVPRPAGTVHFLIMAFEGSFAGADHIHALGWGAFGPGNVVNAASGECQINAVDRRIPASSESVSNWGFLDGHAETLPLSDVYVSSTDNAFDVYLQ